MEISSDLPGSLIILFPTLCFSVALSLYDPMQFFSSRSFVEYRPSSYEYWIRLEKCTLGANYSLCIVSTINYNYVVGWVEGVAYLD